MVMWHVAWGSAHYRNNFLYGQSHVITLHKQGIMALTINHANNDVQCWTYRYGFILQSL